MTLVQNGSLRLFRVAGVDVMIHWSWIIIAVFEMQFRQQQAFSSPLWNAAEFLTAFAIVLLHEIGHVTSCRQVGGTADRIILLPFGGVAYVNPPPRPWPVFWSASGGPLVNLILVPVTVLTYFLCREQGWLQGNHDLQMYLGVTIAINLFLLVFNLLPLYPNDGGQMLYAMCWAVVGRGPALMITSIFGLVGGILVALLCLALGMWILLIFAAMIVLRSFAAFGQATQLMRVMNGPRHREARCPACRAHPLTGRRWVCDECRCRFDTFETLAECPECNKRFEQTGCPECGAKNSIIDWFPRSRPAVPPMAVDTEAPYRPHAEWDQDMPRDHY
jgi:Zn-dependent protease